MPVQNPIGEDTIIEIVDAKANDKVKVSSNDTTADFLKSKLAAGTNITLTEQNDGGNETLEIKSTGAVDPDLHFRRIFMHMGA